MFDWYKNGNEYEFYKGSEPIPTVRVRKNGNHWDALMNNGKCWVIVADFKTLKQAKARINEVYSGVQ